MVGLAVHVKDISGPMTRTWHPPVARRPLGAMRGGKVVVVVVDVVVVDVVLVDVVVGEPPPMVVVGTVDVGPEATVVVEPLSSVPPPLVPPFPLPGSSPVDWPPFV